MFRSKTSESAAQLKEEIALFQGVLRNWCAAMCELWRPKLKEIAAQDDLNLLVFAAHEGRANGSPQIQSNQGDLFHKKDIWHRS